MSLASTLRLVGAEVPRNLAETLARCRRGWRLWALSCTLLVGNTVMALLVHANLALKARNPYAYDLLFSGAPVKSPLAKYLVACGVATLVTLAAPFVGGLARLIPRRPGRVLGGTWRRKI